MSATTGKKPPKECVKFEPQTWRKNLCQNCFRTADQHGGGDAPPKGEKGAKDKAGVKVDAAGKKAGGKLKGDTSTTAKTSDKKGNLDAGKEKPGDKKDKKDKPLFGRFADKAKEKVIEASQAVDKKTPLGVKKKGAVDLKNDDKSDKNDKDKLGKDKSVTEKKTDTSAKDASKDKKDTKPSTPTGKAKKKSWPFDKFDADNAVGSAKGKFDKPALKSKKESPTPKKKTTEPSKEESKSPLVKKKTETKEQIKSPLAKKKTDNVKSPGVKKKNETKEQVKSPTAKKKVEAKDDVKSPTVKKKTEVKEPPTVKKKTWKSEPASEASVKKKGDDKPKEEARSEDSKTEADNITEDRLTSSTAEDSKDSKAEPSELGITEVKASVQDKSRADKPIEETSSIATEALSESSEIIAESQEDKPGTQSPSGEDKAGEEKSPAEPISTELINKSDVKTDVKTSSSSESVPGEKTDKPDVQTAADDETKNKEAATSESVVETTADTCATSGGDAAETTADKQERKVNTAMGGGGEEKSGTDNHSGVVVQAAEEIPAESPISPSPPHRPQPIENMGGFIDISDIGPLSPGITKEINGSKFKIEFRKRETPPSSPRASNKPDNQSIDQSMGITISENLSQSSGGDMGDISNGVSDSKATEGEFVPVQSGIAVGSPEVGLPPSSVGEKAEEEDNSDRQSPRTPGTPTGEQRTQQPAPPGQEAAAEQQASAYPGRQDKNTAALTGPSGAEPRKDDPPARGAAGESEISPEFTSADSPLIHSEPTSQAESDVSATSEFPGPTSEEQTSVTSVTFTATTADSEPPPTPKPEATSTTVTATSGAVSEPSRGSEQSSSSSSSSPSSAPGTSHRAEATITLSGSGGGGDGAGDSPQPPGVSPDFTLPRTVEINPSQVIVHTGPTYHSAEEATTSFITEEGSYSPSQQTGVTSSIFHHQPSPGSSSTTTSSSTGHNNNTTATTAPASPAAEDWYQQQRSQSDDDASIGAEPGQTRRRRRDRQQQVRRRQRQSYDDADYSQGGSRYGDSMSLNVNRDDAMMEGTRMLIDNLREKVAMMEEQNEKMGREKMALADLLTVKKSEYVEMKSKYRGRISDLEDDVNRLQSEKDRLLDKLKLPESERASLAKSDQEIAILNKKIEELENQSEEFLDENLSLKQEVKDLQLEMEEMHDQFREEEALEFRELQKELEATAKNCRILQFKLRKAERRNDQLENDRLTMEDKVRAMEHRFSKSDDKQLIQELEEELKMAKEVSVRLHDELEMVEEKRARYEEELDRVNDILTESESRRQALQREMEALQEENERIRTDEQDAKSAAKHTLGVPARAPSLGQTKKEGSKEGSMEYDVAQLMRDLSDSLERENDLKEQLKFAEEEARIMRKKLSDMDDENESLTLQLQKFSAAKSPKHFRKKDAGDGDVVTEREHDLKLSMELAENEVKVLKRKLDDMEQQNDNLLADLKFYQAKLEGKIDGRAPKPSIDEDERPLEEQISSMAREIDSLKYKLTEQDIEAEDKMRGGRGILKKSKSLEEDMHQPGRGILGESPDIHSQLERVEQEACLLKDKLLRLENENERLLSENKKITMLSSRKVPSITTDDAALQNIELQEKIAQLEKENSSLRDSLRSLDDRTAQLSRQVSRASSSESLLSSDPSEAKTLRDQLHMVDDECKHLRRKVADLEGANIRLTRELRKHKKDTDQSDTNLMKLSKDELKDRVLDLESELKGVISIIKNREDEVDKLEADIEGTKFDMDKIGEVFRARENELIEEADMVQQKNNVLSNLLDLVTERAESTQKELERYIAESEAISCPTSPCTEDAPEKEKKKKKEKGKVTVTKEWEKSMKQRVETLEKTLAETKQKLESKEKKLEAKDTKMSGIKRETKVNKKEMDVLQKELALCTQQLKGSMDEVKELKQRLENVKESHKNVKDDYDKVFNELTEEKDRYVKLETSHEEEKVKAAKEAAKEKKPEKEPASWRWEKKQLEDNLKELEKNVDKLKAELKQQHFKWKLAGEDKEKENKMKDRLENQIKKLKDQLEENKPIIEEAKAKSDELEKSFKVKEDQWMGEKKILEDNAKAAEKESERKDDALKMKDSIVEQKDELIKEKTKAVKDKDKSIKKKDELIKTRDEEIKDKNKEIKKVEEKVTKAKTEQNNLKQQLVEKEDAMKAVTADVRRRDDRIKEKDEILDKINRKLKEKEQEAKDMDNSIRQIMKKLQDKEVELKMLKNSADKSETDVKSLTDQVNELKVKLTESEATQDKLKTVAEQKEKLESKLSTATKEKKALLSDLDDAKEKLKSGEEKWKKEKTKLQLEVKQSKEKVHSLELSRTMKQGEVVKTLSTEKEKLITEKHKLSDDVNKLRKEFQDNSKQWNSEREDLQKIISEKTKMVEDNNAICERMQKEMDNLKSKIGKGGGSKAIPIQVQHESAEIQSFPVRVQTGDSDKKSNDKSSTEAPNAKEKELQIKLEQKELMFSAEKSGLEELYEGRIKLSQENLSQSQDQVSHLRKENQAQLELLQSSRKALADLRSRYDTGLLSWNEERDRIEKKLSKTEGKSAGQSVDTEAKQLRVKLDEAETKMKSAELKLQADQAAWKLEKAALEKKVKVASQAQAAPGPGRPGGGVSEFRAKFERFESKKAPAARPPGAAVSTAAEDKAVTDAQKAVKDLKKQLDALEKECEKNKKELLEKVEKSSTGTLKKDKSSDSKEKKELKERNTQLEQKLKDFEQTSKSLVDIQCSVQEEKEKWQLEKNQIFRQLDETKQLHMSDKGKINELLAEIKKLRTLTPALEGGSQERRSRLRRTPSVERRKTSTVINLSADKDKEGDDEVKRALDQPAIQYLKQALEHISRLAEGFNQAHVQVPLRTSERKSQAPPQFRRSLSTSEIEEGLQTYVGKSPDSLVFHAYQAPKVKASPTPVIIPKPPVSERSSRPRDPRRALSSAADNNNHSNNGGDAPLTYESATVDRRSFRAGAGQEHKRSSVHASGTMSAMTSRDASPEKGFRSRRKSPYPVAPPSMIITPSHTPRREQSVERGAAEEAMSKSEMNSLYAKLSEIEAKESNRSQNRALQKERGQGIRVLTHSASVDNALEEPQTPLSPEVVDPAASSTAEGESSSKGAYFDANPSESLPASIRHSGLVITPGVEKFSLGLRKRAPGKQKRSASVSPKTARKQFYEDYPYDPKNIFSRLTRKMSTSDLRSAEASRDTTLQKQVSAPAESLSAAGGGGRDKSMFSSATNFFDAVKQKRKMFGSKKATSVDTPVHKEIARMGTTVLPSHAAPSTYSPPPVPPAEKENPPPPKEEKKKKKSFLHRRSASIDAGSLFSSRGSSRRSQSSDRQPLLSADTSSSDSRDRSRKQDGTNVEEENSRQAAELEVVHIVAIPPLTKQFTKPQPPRRTPPKRWISLKKAMLEQPIQIRAKPEAESESPPPILLEQPAFYATSPLHEAWNFTETSV